MQINFGSCSPSGFRDKIAFKFGQISLLDHGLYNYSPWVSKKFDQLELAQKFMQVGVDV